jgi:hypothetical protein
MTHAAYIAGFVDADGCISIHHKVVYRPRTGKQLTDRQAYFNCSVIVVQKNDVVVKRLLEENGGTINITKRGSRCYYRWSVSGKAALKLLRKIRPYLIEKQEQADLAIKGIVHRLECGRGRYKAGCEGTQPLTEQDLSFREGLWLRNKSLNTCHKIRAAAETKSNDPVMGCDSPSPAVMSGEAAKASAA